MAFGRLERNPGSQPMSDINMTPLIDVMLVLLVIFIITAPLMASSLKLDLPKADGGAGAAKGGTLMLSIDAQGQIFLDDKPSAPTQLIERAKQAATRDPSTEVQLRADQRVPYGRVVEIIALVQKAGLSRIGFVTDKPALAPADKAAENLAEKAPSLPGPK